MNVAERREAAAPLAALALWILCTMAWRPLALPDEGRYVGVALEMLRGGDPMVPTLFGLPYFHKPPLMYWIDAAAMQVLGVSTFAARVAPAVGGWLTGLALWIELHAQHDTATARLGLTVLATTPLFFFGAQFANLDMLVAGLIALAIASARRALAEPGRLNARWCALAWASAALALLAKGLIGVVLPALVVLPWLVAARRWGDLLRMFHPAGLALFVAIAAPWFVAMQQRFPGFAEYFFVEQHFRRYAGSGFNNPQPFWFFIVALPLLTLPWSLWLVPALRRWGALTFHAWWVAAVLAFFSWPVSKLVGYVLPALAPWVVLLAAPLASGRAWRWLAPLSALLCLALLAGAAWVAPKSNREIGLALGQGLRAGDAVVFIEGAFFDVPFYARLDRPPAVMSDWDDPRIPQRDDWRKELHDAARFAPAQGARTLLREREVAALACRAPTLWLVSPAPWRPPAHWGAFETVREGREARLWRSLAPRPPCP